MRARARMSITKGTGSVSALVSSADLKDDAERRISRPSFDKLYRHRTTK